MIIRPIRSEPIWRRIKRAATRSSLFWRPNEIYRLRLGSVQNLPRLSGVRQQTPMRDLKIISALGITSREVASTITAKCKILGPNSSRIKGPPSSLKPNPSRISFQTLQDLSIRFQEGTRRRPCLVLDTMDRPQAMRVATTHGSKEAITCVTQKIEKIYLV